MKLLAAAATGACALGSAWQGLAGCARGVVLVFKRSGGECRLLDPDGYVLMLAQI